MIRCKCGAVAEGFKPCPKCGFPEKPSSKQGSVKVPEKVLERFNAESPAKCSCGHRYGTTFEPCSQCGKPRP